MFFDGAFRPHPDSLVAQLHVDALDGLLRLGHRGHHGIRLRGRYVAVLVYGDAVHEAQVLVERQLAEEVAAGLEIGVV